jgi:PAS domain S-box-containing protein/putative nucleotidyltransferase with HDIG domain
MNSLKILETRYKLLFDTAADAILIMEGDRFVDCNESALRLFGCERRQLLGATPEMFSPAYQPTGQSSKALANEKIMLALDGKPQQFEWLHTRFDGSPINVEISLNALVLEGGRTLQGIMRDVTERKQLMEAVQSDLLFEKMVADISACLLGSRVQELNADIEASLRHVCEFMKLDLSAIYQPIDDSISALEMTHSYIKKEGPPPPSPLRANEFFPWCCEEAMAGREVRIDSVESMSVRQSRDQESFRFFNVKRSLNFPLIDRGNAILGVITFNSISHEGAWDSQTIDRAKLVSRIFAYTLSRQKADTSLQNTLADTVRTIATIVEMRDPYTAGHQQRVADLSVEIGRELGLDSETLEELRMGATLHDIGKLRIPAEILNRPGKLTDAEFQLIREHPQTGYEIIKNMNLLPGVAQMVRQHHEKFDGTGYPDALNGDEIRLEARIIAVADAVEAMSSHRPYRPALGIEAALIEITGRKGTAYDPKVVDACLKVLHKEASDLAVPL